MIVTCPRCEYSMFVSGSAYVNGNDGTTYEVEYTCPVCDTIVYLRTPAHIRDPDKEPGR